MNTPDARAIVAICCNANQFIPPQLVELNNEITCYDCGRPMVMKGSDGHWYFVGGKVFEDNDV